MRDEGIVQPVSKEMDKLSRRLHQMWVIPGEIRGIPGGTSIKYAMIQYRTTRKLTARIAAYVAGLIDGVWNRYALPSTLQQVPAG
jgi:hypothetical protein